MSHDVTFTKLLRSEFISLDEMRLCVWIVLLVGPKQSTHSMHTRVGQTIVNLHHRYTIVSSFNHSGIEVLLILKIRMNFNDALSVATR